MLDREDVGSWMSGPGTPPAEGDYPGARLGRPQMGPGSVAGSGRRLLAILLDWAMCLLIAHAFLGPAATRSPGSLWVNVIFAVENLLLVGTAGATLGQRIVGLDVQRLDGGRPTPGRSLLRAVLVGLGLPALTALWERDRRGLHDLAAGTVVVRR